MTAIQSQPMRYLIQEKHLSLDNRITITDDAGLIHYKVNSTFFAMGDKLSLSDANGNELMKIRQDKLHLHLTYKIVSTRSGATEHEIAVIKRTGPIWQHKLLISATNGEYVMQKKSGAPANEYTLTKNDDVVALVIKDASPTKCLYWVNIVDDKEENHAFVMAIVIVLSCAQRLPVNPMGKHAGNETKSS